MSTKLLVAYFISPKIPPQLLVDKFSQPQFIGGSICTHIVFFYWDPHSLTYRLCVLCVGFFFVVLWEFLQLKPFKLYPSFTPVIWLKESLQSILYMRRFSSKKKTLILSFELRSFKIFIFQMAFFTLSLIYCTVWRRCVRERALNSSLINSYSLGTVVKCTIYRWRFINRPKYTLKTSKFHIFYSSHTKRES